VRERQVNVSTIGFFWFLANKIKFDDDVLMLCGGVVAELLDVGTSVLVCQLMRILMHMGGMDCFHR
jgi:hypothetical protein